MMAFAKRSDPVSQDSWAYVKPLEVAIIMQMEQRTFFHRRRFGVAILSALSACSTAALFGDNDRQNSVVKWIRQRAFPLRGISPDLPHRDLVPMKQALADVQVVGIGENNHGASEYQIFKHRFFRFLVEEMGFTAFALEASYSSCKAIDDYVVKGTGRLEEVLTGQGYTAWDTLEMTALLAWMREYNRSAKPGKQVRFFGLDISYNERGRKNVLAWLQLHAPDRAAAAETLLGAVGEEEYKWPGRTNADHVKAMLTDIQALASFVRETSKKVLPAADPMEDAVWDMTVIEQWVISNSGGVNRTEWMGHNLNRLLNCYPGIEVMVSAFNYHISHIPETTGGVAREKLGKGYYSLAAEFSSGSFRVRVKDADNFFSAYREVTPPPAPAQSVPSYLANSGKGSMLLDFREPTTRTEISDWIDKPQMMHAIPWSPTDNTFYKPYNMPESYDGIYFIDEIRPDRATVNGEIAARDRLRF